MTDYATMLRFLTSLKTRLGFSEHEKRVIADLIERVGRLQGCAESAEKFPKATK